MYVALHPSRVRHLRPSGLPGRRVTWEVEVLGIRSLIRLLPLAVVLAVGGVVATGQSASAAPICPEPWANEQAMANEPSAECRSTWLDDPGVGQFLTRAQLLAR